MGKRRTECFSYGEDRRTHERGNGWCVTFAQYRTACGEWVDDVSFDVPDLHVYRRPIGVCRKCWADWQRARRLAIEL